MLIIFDLDGTLIDSAKDLAISMNATRAHLGMGPLDPRLIYSFVGNGAGVLVRRALGPEVSEQTVSEALQFFLKYYRAHAVEHTRLYPGVSEVIDTLADDGHTLAVLTNKPVKISVDIIGALGLATRFAQVYGGDSFSAKKPDPVGITTLMAQTATPAYDTCMVGDSAVDVQTARNAGVFSYGVAWGFQPDSFDRDEPDMLVGVPEALLEAIRSATR